MYKTILVNYFNKTYNYKHIRYDVYLLITLTFFMYIYNNIEIVKYLIPQQMIDYIFTLS